MQLHFGVLCDQVRREDNGKLIIIGVYASDVIVPRFPSDTLLSLALSFRAELAEATKFSLTVTLNAQELVSGSSEFQVTDTKTAFVVFQNIPIHLREEGRLEFLVESGGQSLKAWTGDVLAQKLD
jgi:hypothetical protein